LNVYRIPAALEAKYDGCGHALAAVAGGELVDLVYIEDVLPDFDSESDQLASIVTDARLGSTVRYLSGLGEVSVGLCSCWEFCEL